MSLMYSRDALMIKWCVGKHECYYRADGRIMEDEDDQLAVKTDLLDRLLNKYIGLVYFLYCLKLTISPTHACVRIHLIYACRYQGNMRKCARG